MTRTYRVTITRKEGLSDPEGTTTRKALNDLGFDDVEAVSFGRVLTVTLSGDDASSAEEALTSMCEKLLANPVMENYTIEQVS